MKVVMALGCVVGLTFLSLGLAGCSADQGRAQPTAVEIHWPDAGVAKGPTGSPAAAGPAGSSQAAVGDARAAKTVDSE